MQVEDPITLSAAPGQGGRDVARTTSPTVPHHGVVTTVAPPPTARTSRPLRVRLALFAAVTLLAVSNVVSNRVWPQGYLVWNPAMAGVLLLLARAGGPCGREGREGDHAPSCGTTP